MATGTLTNTIKDPSGTALSGVTVNARLKPSGGFRTDASEIARLESTTTNASGAWSLTLEANADISPAGTYWEIEEQIPDANGGPATWAVSVTSGTSQSVQAALVSALPAYVTGSYLTQASADLRYQTLGGVTSASPAAISATAVVGTATAAARADHTHGFGTGSPVAGTGLNVDASGILNVGADAGVYAVGTNSLGVRVTGFLTATASVAIYPGYRVPAAQTATPSVVTVGAGDLWFDPANNQLLAFEQPANAWVSQTPAAAYTPVTVSATVTATHTAYADPTTGPAGPAQTIRTGTKALVILTCQVGASAASANLYMGYAVTGATTIAPSDDHAGIFQWLTTNPNLGTMTYVDYIDTLTAGVNTFTAKYRTSASTPQIHNRRIVVIPL